MESNFLKNGTNELFKRQIHRFSKTNLWFIKGETWMGRDKLRVWD